MAMWMNLYDSDADNPLFARIGSENDPKIDYDYQAEQWVSDTVDRVAVVKWVLYDNEGERCVWERESGDSRLPVITSKEERYQGEYCVTYN